MIIGATLLTALGAAVLATILFCLITRSWNWITFVAYVAYGAVLVFVALNGPIRIGT